MQKTCLFLITTLIATSNLKVAAMQQEEIRYPSIPTIQQFNFHYHKNDIPQTPYQFMDDPIIENKKKKSNKNKLPKEKIKPDPVFLKNFYDESRHVETKKLCQDFDSKLAQVIHKFKDTHQTPIIVKDPIVKHNILLTISLLEKSVRGLSRCSSLGRKKYFYSLANKLKLELLHLFAHLCTDRENDLLLARKHTLNSKKILTKISRKIFLTRFKPYKYQVTKKFSPYSTFFPNETRQEYPTEYNTKSHCKELVKLSKQFVDDLLETIEHAIEKKHGQHNIKLKKYRNFDIENHIYQKFQKYQNDTDFELYFKALLGKKSTFRSSSDIIYEFSLPYLK